MSANSWGECVLNNIEFGADGQRVGGETTNILSESNAFLIAENDKLIITKPDVVTFSGVLSKHTFDKWDALRESIKTLYAAEKQAEDEAANTTSKGKKQFS